MTRQEAEYVLGWLRASYPRNYKDMDARQAATMLDNLTKVFAHNTYREVQAEYERVYGMQKNEPHPSEIRAHLSGETRKQMTAAAADPYEKLQRHPKWDDMCRAYGERACRRAAKLCTETAGIHELRFRLETDIPCREGRFNTSQ